MLNPAVFCLLYTVQDFIINLCMKSSSQGVTIQMEVTEKNFSV